jgi:hypothetical protein
MPSTTIIAQPSVLMPAYNPIKYIIDNTNKNEPGFRYIFTIYPAAGSHIPANVVAQYRVLPVFSTGYGEQDISRLMQSLVTWNFASGQVNESWYQYDIDLGYEFIDNIDYITTLQDNGGNVRISFTAHGFVAGDQIIIAQDGTGPVDNPALEGLHTVLSATANQFTVNVLFSTITDSTANGNVSYADQRKTQVLDDEVIETMEVFNGAYSLGIYAQGSFPSVTYLGTLDPSYALTSLTNPNDSFAVAASITDNIFYLMCRVYSGVEYILQYYDSQGNAIGQDSPYNPTDGLYNFPVNTATHSITEDFYIGIKANDFAGTEFKYFFNYDGRCAINEDILYYLDRMGSWQSFNFQLKTYEKGQISREMYNQHVDGQVVSNEWEYSSDAMGSRTYNINVSNTLDLNTNWMDQYNANRFQELLTSPQVFYYNGTDYRACTIDSTSFENFRQRNKNLIKQSVTIKLALNTPING